MIGGRFSCVCSVADLAIVWVRRCGALRLTLSVRSPRSASFFPGTLRRGLLPDHLNNIIVLLVLRISGRGFAARIFHIRVCTGIKKYPYYFSLSYKSRLHPRGI